MPSTPNSSYTALARSKADKRYNEISEKLRVARIYIGMLIATNDSNVQPWNAKPKKPNYLTPKSLAAAAGISRGAAFRLVTELRTFGGVVEKLGSADEMILKGRPTLYLPVVADPVEDSHNNTTNKYNNNQQEPPQELKDKNITTTIRGTLVPPAPTGANRVGNTSNRNSSNKNQKQKAANTAVIQTTMRAAQEALRQDDLQTVKAQLEQALQKVNQQLQQEQGGDDNVDYAPPIPPPHRPPPTSQLGKRSLPTGGNENDDNSDSLQARQYVTGQTIDDAHYSWKKLHGRMMWTPQEDEALIAGFQEFGRNYQRIKEKVAPILDRRSHVQLKDHVKLLIQRGLLQDQPYHPGQGGGVNANVGGTATTLDSNKRQKTGTEQQQQNKQQHIAPPNWELFNNNGANNNNQETEEEDDEDIEEDEDTDEEQVANLLV